MLRFAIVLTHNRPELLAQCEAAIGPQVDCVVILDNASDPPVEDITDLGNWGRVIVRDPTQPPNLSQLWNRGIDTARAYIDLTFGEDVDEWIGAFLCDDAIAPVNWFNRVEAEMIVTGASAGSTHCAAPVTAPIFKTEPDHDVWNRMCPWAFVIRGDRGLKADEDLQWWWGDTHMDFTARLNGGMVIAPGPVVENQRMGEFTNIYPHLAEQAGRDTQVFELKWGGRPW